MSLNAICVQCEGAAAYQAKRVLQVTDRLGRLDTCGSCSHCHLALMLLVVADDFFIPQLLGAVFAIALGVDFEEQAALATFSATCHSNILLD